MVSPRPADHPDTADMMAIHKSLRREFGLMPTLIAAAPAGQRDRVRLLGAHLMMEMQQLHDHHAAEDIVLWPKLLRTGRINPVLVDLMEEQHHELADQIDALRPVVTDWIDHAGESQRDDIAVALRQLSDSLDVHLAVEEDELLPLVRQYLTSADWDALRAESGRRVPKNPRVAFRLVGGLLEDADDHERQVLLDQMPGPIRWYVTTVGARAYRRYVDEVRQAS